MSIKHLLNQTCTIENPSGTRDRYGKPSFDAATTYACRAQATNKTITTAEREKDPIHLITFLDTGDTINIGARLTYSSNVYRVLAVEEVVGYGGNRHHLELMCQLWNLP